MIKFFIAPIAILLILYILTEIIAFIVYMMDAIKLLAFFIILMFAGSSAMITFNLTKNLFFNDYSIPNTTRLTVLGTICSTILAFLGTYVMFILKLNNENKKTKNEKKLDIENEKKSNIELLIAFLEYTISETQSTMEAICDEFIMVTCKDKNIRREKFINEIEDIQDWFKETLITVSNTQKNRLCDFLKEDVYSSLPLLVYDYNWQMYLKYEEKFYISAVANWVRILELKESQVELFIKNRDIVVEYLRLLKKKYDKDDIELQYISALKDDLEIRRDRIVKHSIICRLFDMLVNKICDALSYKSESIKNSEEKELKEKGEQLEEEIKIMESNMKTKILSNKHVNLSNEIVIKYLDNLKTAQIYRKIQSTEIATIKTEKKIL